jgi:Flp pilus assembly protein TadD
MPSPELCSTILRRTTEAHNNVGEALVAGEQFDEAIAHFREALGVNPEHASAHYNLGAALAQLGREAEAIPHLWKAVVQG